MSKEPYNKIYECNECKLQFLNTELQYEKIPSNITLGPGTTITDKGIPKCPHCGHLSVSGFTIIDIAF